MSALPSELRAALYALGIAGAAAASIAIVLLLTASGSLTVWVMAGAAVVALVALLQPGTPEIRLGVVLVGAASMFGVEEGLQSHEIAYGLVMIAYLGSWYVSRWMSGRPLVVSVTDLAIALWLTVGVGGAALLGPVFGIDVPSYRSEIIAMVPMYFYFPVKEACAGSKRGFRIMTAAFVALGVYATISGAIWLRTTIALAENLFEIADARFTVGESFMALSFLFALALSAASDGWRARGLWLVAASIVLGGLILTRTRSFWISTVLGLGVMLVVMNGPDRRRTTVYLVAGTVALGLIAVVQFREQMMLLIAGTVGRFSSLGSASTGDASLLARFSEYHALAGQIAANPFLGYGWGVPYSHYSALSAGTRTWSFTHNGWLYVWYKTGLWGLAIMGVAWVSAGWTTMAAARATWMPRTQRTMGAAIVGGLVTYAVAANAANPYFGQDTVLAVALLLAMASGLGQRCRAMTEILSDVDTPNDGAQP